MSEGVAAGPKGIGGWLILVMLGLIIGPLRIGYFMLETYVPIFTDGSWSQLTTEGTEVYHPLWGPLLIFEVFGNSVSILLAIAALICLLLHSRYTPRLAITSYAWPLAFVIADFLAADQIPAIAAQEDPESIREVVRSIIFAAIWIPYFLVSKRVKATFVD
jgi:hypothetical protein